MAWIKEFVCPNIEADITTKPGKRVPVYMLGRKLPEQWPSTETVTATVRPSDSCGDCTIKEAATTKRGTLETTTLDSGQEVFKKTAFTSAVEAIIKEVNSKIPPTCPRLRTVT